MFQRLLRPSLLLLPLLLAALLGGVKWKQMHPTPTPLDLQERARLMEAKSVEVDADGRKFVLPTKEFKETLANFYLLEPKVRDVFSATAPYPTLAQRRFRRWIIISVKDSKPLPLLAEIHLESPTSYQGDFSGMERHPTSSGTIGSLHPVTQLRLSELIIRHLPAK